MKSFASTLGRFRFIDEIEHTAGFPPIGVGPMTTPIGLSDDMEVMAQKEEVLS